MKLQPLIFLIGLSLNLQSAVACSCKGFKTLRDAYNYSNTVSVGTIISEEYVTLTDSTSFFNKVISIVRCKFLIDKVYKGSFTKDTVLVFTGSGGGDCGYHFSIGSRYIVYGMNKTCFPIMGKHKFPKDKNSTWTYICLPTTNYTVEKINELNIRNGQKVK